MTAPSYQSEISFGNKVSRQIWMIAQGTVFRLGLRNSHGWRIFWLRCFGAKIAGGCKVYPGVRVWAPWNLEMEENSCLGDRVDCYNVALITLNSGAIVSQDVSLCAATHDYESPAFTLLPKPITVGAGAWVCARAFIGPGVTVGEGAVVGACAVVIREVSPRIVVAGNPAKEIKERSNATPAE